MRCRSSYQRRGWSRLIVCQSAAVRCLVVDHQRRVQQSACQTVSVCRGEASGCLRWWPELVVQVLVIAMRRVLAALWREILCR